jgi:hypothetical protein
MAKYKNKKSGGFHSTREHMRALELRQEQKDGKIQYLVEQETFTVIEPQYEDVLVTMKTKTKIKRKLVEHGVKYIADFTYTRNGLYVVEDSKGCKTADYIIKRKLMLQVHGIKVLET